MLRSPRSRWWSSLLAVALAGCLPLDAELPAVAPFDDGADPSVDGGAAVDARPPTPDGAVDAGPDAAPPDAGPDGMPDAGPDAMPDADPDAAPPDVGPDATTPDGAPPDAGPARCPEEALVPGASQTLLGPRDPRAVGVDPTSLAFVDDDLFVLDGRNRRVLRITDGRVYPLVGEVPGAPFAHLRPAADRVARPLLDMSAGRGALFVTDGARVMRLDPSTDEATVVQMDGGDGLRPLALPGGETTRLAFQDLEAGIPRLLLAGPEPWPAHVWEAVCVTPDCFTVRAPERFGGFRAAGVGVRHCNDAPAGDRVVYDEVRAIAADPTQVAIAVRGRDRNPNNGCSPEFEWLLRKVDGVELRQNKAPCLPEGCNTRIDAAPWVDIAFWQGDIYAVESARNRVIRVRRGDAPPESAVANPTGSAVPAEDGACAALTGFDGLTSIAIAADGRIAVGSRGRVELLEASAGCGGDLARRRVIGLPDDRPLDLVSGRPGTAQAVGEPRSVAVLGDVAHIADRTAGLVHRVSLLDGRLLEPVDPGPGSGPTGLVVDGDRIWGVAGDPRAAEVAGGAEQPRLFAIEPGAEQQTARTIPWAPQVQATCRANDPGLYAPLDLAVGPDGLYAADLYRVRRFAVMDDAGADFEDLLTAPPPVPNGCAAFRVCLDNRNCLAADAALPALGDGERVSSVAVVDGVTWVGIEGRPGLWRCDDEGCAAAPDAVPGAPTALIRDGGDVLAAWVGDDGAHRLARLGDGADALATSASPITGAAVDARDDALLVAAGHRVRRLDAQGEATLLVGARDPRGLGPLDGGWLPAPTAIAPLDGGRWAVAGQPGRLFVVDPGANVAEALLGDPGGGAPDDADPCDGTRTHPAFAPALADGLAPARLSDGRLLIADPAGGRLWTLDAETLRCVWRGDGEPTGAAIDPDSGAIYVALGTTVHRFDPDGDGLALGPAMARLGVDKGRLAVAVDAGTLFIGARGGALFARDLSPEAPLEVIEAVEANEAADIVAVAAGLGRVFYATRQRVWQYDPSTDRVALVWPRAADTDAECIAGLALRGDCGAAELMLTDRCAGAVVQVPLGR